MKQLLWAWSTLPFHMLIWNKPLGNGVKRFWRNRQLPSKMLKFAFNLTDDGMVGQQVFAGEATRLAYMTDEAKEGRNAFLEKRKPDFSNIKWIP